MQSKSYLSKKIYGEAILERLSRSPHAGALKKEAQVYKAAQADFGKAYDKVAAAQGRRDDALEGLGELDGRLDKALLLLADRLVGAGLGKRQNPFSDYCRYSPAKLTELGYAAEEKETRALLAALRKKKLSAELTAACKAVAAAADGVAGGLKGLAAPQADYEATMRARDGLLLTLSKALGRLKRAAAVAYDEDRAGYRGLFAAVNDLQSPRRRLRGKPATPPAPAPPMP